VLTAGDGHRGDRPGPADRRGHAGTGLQDGRRPSTASIRQSAWRHSGPLT